jgi:hypothetical protein
MLPSSVETLLSGQAEGIGEGESTSTEAQGSGGGEAIEGGS